MKNRKNKKIFNDFQKYGNFFMLFLYAVKNLNYHIVESYFYLFKSFLRSMLHHKPTFTSSFHFRVKKKVQFGEAVFAIGNIPELGNWDIEHALKLTWTEGHFWVGQTTGVFVGGKEIEFKYVVGQWWCPSTGKLEWQAGKSNRKIKTKGKVSRDDVWNMENMVLNLLIKNNDFANNQFFVCGSCKDLGQWRECKKLQQQLSQNGIPINLSSQQKNQLQQQTIFTYRFKVYRGARELNYYYIKRSHKPEIQRIPGRKFNLQTSTSPHPHCLSVQHRSSSIYIYDKCSFTQLIFSQINSDILVGPYVKRYEDLEALKAQNVGAILSIQSQQDYKQHSLSSQFISSLCQQFEISFNNFSILDANSVDFVKRGFPAVKLLAKLIKKHQQKRKKVYIHCTAGIYRSPQIIVLYLCLFKEMGLKEGIKFVKEKHGFAKPSQRVLGYMLEQEKKIGESKKQTR